MSEPCRPGLELEWLGVLLDEPEEGRRWLISALRENPYHGPTHAALGDYYEKEKNNQLAAFHRRLAIAGGTDASKIPSSQ